MTEKKEILKSASIISLVTIVSRVLGYVRDQRISFLLGTSLSADAFVLAYRIPNLFRRLVGEGTVAASFIPVFTTYMRDSSSEQLWAFANRLFWTLALVLAVVTVLGVIFSQSVIFAPSVIQTLSTSSPQDRSVSWEEAIVAAISRSSHGQGATCAVTPAILRGAGGPVRRRGRHTAPA